MTLVLSSRSAFQASTSTPHLESMRWSPMTPTTDVPIHSTLGLPSHGYASSASSSNATGSTPTALRKSSGGQVKKRASRAGTRSVSTLSAAQLERKRANDREAQRAIRQRTKDHIDGLEATLNDVKQTLENREKLLAASHQRNRELEEENAVLRMRLNEANVSPTLTQKCTYQHHVLLGFLDQADSSQISDLLILTTCLLHRRQSQRHLAPCHNVQTRFLPLPAISQFTPAALPITQTADGCKRSSSSTQAILRPQPTATISCSRQIKTR